MRPLDFVCARIGRYAKHVVIIPHVPVTLCR
jgi:hypothetical protein